jgi:hypothetical protein
MRMVKAKDGEEVRQMSDLFYNAGCPLPHVRTTATVGQTILEAAQEKPGATARVGGLVGPRHAENGEQHVGWVKTRANDPFYPVFAK